MNTIEKIINGSEKIRKMFLGNSDSVPNECSDNGLSVEDIVSLIMVGPCPNCGSESTHDGDDAAGDDEIGDTTIGICRECGHHWCLECGQEAKDGIECPHWGAWAAHCKAHDIQEVDQDNKDEYRAWLDEYVADLSGENKIKRGAEELDQAKREHLQAMLLEIAKIERDLAKLVEAGVVPLDEASAHTRALLVTRQLHPDMLEYLDRVEEFEGPGLPQDSIDEPSPRVHARMHVEILANAMENDYAGAALYHLFQEARQHQQNDLDAIHTAVHVLTMIQLQLVCALSTHKKGQRQAEFEEAMQWFEHVCCGELQRLPPFLLGVLAKPPSHPWE